MKYTDKNFYNLTDFGLRASYRILTMLAERHAASLFAKRTRGLAPLLGKATSVQRRHSIDTEERSPARGVGEVQLSVYLTESPRNIPTTPRKD